MLYPSSKDDREDLAALADRAGISPSDVPGIAAGSPDATALELRRAWLARAHHPADSTLKVPRGWLSMRILCRSGQAALSCLLHLVAHEATTPPLTVHHAGRYFETATLLDLWPRQVFAPRDEIGTGPNLFENRCHPSRLSSEAVALFCAIWPGARQRQMLRVIEADRTETGSAISFASWRHCRPYPPDGRSASLRTISLTISAGSGPMSTTIGHSSCAGSCRVPNWLSSRPTGMKWDVRAVRRAWISACGPLR
jgi:hypothetical protein